MIVLPVKISSLLNVPNAPLTAPYRAVDKGASGYINNVPSALLVSYTRLTSGFFQADRNGATFYDTGINLSNVNYTTCILQNKYVLAQRTANRTLNKINYVIDPFSGRVEYAEMSSPINMMYCGTGGVNTITGFIVPFMDTKTNIVLWNTYSGGVTGGADTCAVNMYNDFTVGFNSKWNGNGAGPYESPASDLFYSSSLNPQIRAVQIGEKLIASYNQTSYMLKIYSFDNGIIDAGSCGYNVIIPKVTLLQSIDVRTILPGSIYIDGQGQINSKMDNSFVLSLYGPAATYTIYARFPGPVVQIMQTPYYGTPSGYCSFIDDAGYIIWVQNNDSGSNVFNAYMSADALRLNVSFSVPAKAPPPEPVNKTNTIRKFNIDRTF